MLYPFELRARKNNRNRLHFTRNRFFRVALRQQLSVSSTDMLTGASTGTIVVTTPGATLSGNAAFQVLP